MPAHMTTNCSYKKISTISHSAALGNLDQLETEKWILVKNSVVGRSERASKRHALQKQLANPIIP